MKLNQVSSSIRWGLLGGLMASASLISAPLMAEQASQGKAGQSVSGESSGTSSVRSSSESAFPGNNAEANDNKITVVSKRGTIAYVSASGTKDDTPIVETPISVSVLTEQRIQDLGAETIQDALGYVAGVYNGPFGVDTRGDWSMIRGASPVQYLDGMKVLYGYYNNVRPNPYSLGQIEVLKGPASVLYGQGTIGGIVNLVSKRPQAQSEAEVWGQLGNYNRRQLAFDVTDAANGDASVLYRLSGMFRDSETQTDFVNDDSYFLAPALTFYLGESTEWTLLANAQKNESGSSTQFLPHVGTIFPTEFGQIPSNRFVSEPGFDRYDTEQTAITSIVDHDLNGDWSVHWSARYMDSQAEYRTMYPYRFNATGSPFDLLDDNRTIVRSIYMADKEAESLTSDLRLHGHFETGSVTHNFVLGFDYQQADLSDATLFGYEAGGPLDVYAPVYGSIDLSTEPDFTSASAATQQQSGIYLQNQMRFNDDLIVSLGLRSDKAKTGEYQNPQNDYSETTKRLGVLYRFDNGMHPYISYSESFDLIAGIDASGNLLKPKMGEQKEIGLKYQPQGTAHLITFSAFDTVEKNRTVNVIVNGQPSIAQIGEATVKGTELEAQLEWDTVDVYASFTNISEAKDETNTNINSVPENMLSVWGTYRPNTFWQGFKIGGGVRYVGESHFTTLQNGVATPVTTDTYTLFDLLLGYELGNFDVSLNVDNVTDKTVITTCLDRGDCFYGQRRTITANVRYSF
ncbi:TonB-dependent siderophore receptor [Pleionea mediterranea]|nr:TonB-dependent siderophore receptor [Pleionea mediterranea]